MSDERPGRVDLGDRYRSVRERLGAVLEEVDDDGWVRPVPACPGWRVKDVLGHLVGLIEDASSGRIDGPPGPEVTDEEVRRHHDDDPDQLLAAWHASAPPFEEVVASARIWPAFIDVLSHEHDVRGALDRPGARDHEDVQVAATALVRSLECRPRLRVVTERGSFTSGAPPQVTDGAVAPDAAHREQEGPLLRTSSFEVLRLRMGRRSLAQVLALDWEGDPTSVVDELFVFGPAATDLVEPSPRGGDRRG